MNVREAVILGVFLTVGLGLHGYLSQPPKPAARDFDMAAEAEGLKAQGQLAAVLQPKVLELKEQTLLCVPQWTVQGRTLKVNNVFYRLEKGVLVAVTGVQ